MYVGNPAMSPSVPVGVPMASMPDRQHDFIVGWLDIVMFLDRAAIVLEGL